MKLAMPGSFDARRPPAPSFIPGVVTADSESTYGSATVSEDGQKNEPAAVAAAGSWAYAIRLLAERPMNLRDQLVRTRGRGGGVIAGIGA